MIDLDLLLRNVWEKRFGKVFERDERKSKSIPFDSRHTTFTIFHSRRLEEWYLSENGKKRYKRSGCFFCNGDRLEVVVTFNHLKFCYNPKFAARSHFLIAPQEHREFPVEKDIFTLHEAASLTRFSIIGNLKDSGASYPQHVHYQSLDIVFPITKVYAKSIFCNDMAEVFRLNYPVTAFKLYSSDKNGWVAIARTVASITSPFNPLFYQNNVFIIPRSKSFPFNTDGFKFAAAEVCGGVFTRTKKMYETLNCTILKAALIDVCLPNNSNESEQFENSLIRNLKEFCNE